MSRTRHHGRRGAGALGFALTMPILLAVAFAIAEMGLFLHDSQIVSRAARDAGRIGSGVIEGLDADGSEIEAAAERHALFVLRASGIDCDAVLCEAEADWFLDDEGWMMLEVRVEVPYEPLTNLLPWLPTTLAQDFITLTRQQ
jgi:hypothetical protein